MESDKERGKTPYSRAKKEPALVNDGVPYYKMGLRQLEVLPHNYKWIIINLGLHRRSISMHDHRKWGSGSPLSDSRSMLVSVMIKSIPNE